MFDDHGAAARKPQKMNEAILRMTSSTGGKAIDEQLMVETLLEVEKGWADSPYDGDWPPEQWDSLQAS